MSVSLRAATWRVCVASTITQSSPAVLSWRGETIVAVGDESGYVHVLNAATGRELPGWPKRMVAPPGASVAIESTPAIAFLDGAKKPPSIIVGSGSTWVPNSVGEVEAFRLNGKERFVYRVGVATGTAVGVISSPAVGALTGKGSRDVVFGSWDHDLYALTPSGALVPGFPVNTADTIWSSPALYHRAGSIGDDIYIGGDASGLDGCVGGWISDYRYIAGAPRLVWRNCESQSIWSSPAIGDVHGQPAVFVGTSFFEQPFPAGTDHLYAYYAATGAPVPGWPVKTPGPALGSPAIGMIDDSSTPAVVDTSFVCQGNTESSCFGPNRSNVSAWSVTGQLLWSIDLLGPTALGSPVLVPLRGETTDANDVLVGTPNGLYPLAGSSGTPLFGTNATNQFAAINPGCRVFNSPAVGQITDAEGNSTWYAYEACGGPPAFHTPGEIAAFELPDQPEGLPAWPMFRQSPSHEGLDPS